MREAGVVVRGIAPNCARLAYADVLHALLFRKNDKASSSPCRLAICYRLLRGLQTAREAEEFVDTEPIAEQSHYAKTAVRWSSETWQKLA